MASQAATDEAKHPDGAATAKEFVVVVDDGVSLAASLHAKDLARFEAVGNAVKSVQPEVCVDVDTSAPRCAVLCHGLLGRRSSAFLPQLRTRLLEGTVDAVMLYDSRGNGDSTGQASIAGYHRDVRDLACVVAGLRACGLRVEAVVGHSRGANVVLLHAAQWCSGSARVPLVCAIAPRFDMAALPSKYFTPQQRASVGFGRDASSGVGASAGSGSGEAGEQGSFVWHTWSSRNPAVPVTRAHLEEVSSLDMRRQCCLVPPTTRVLLCHGTSDEVIPVEDAAKFVGAVRSLTLRLFADANHSFTDGTHASRLIETVVEWTTAHTAAPASGAVPAPTAWQESLLSDEAVEHVYLKVTSFTSSEPFYDTLLVGVLGFRKGIAPIDGTRHCHYITPTFNLAVSELRKATAGEVDPAGRVTGPGLHHLCLRVKHRDSVDTLCRQLKELGVAHTPAQEYPYAKGYYSTFFRDPDGIKIEVMAELQHTGRRAAWGAAINQATADALEVAASKL